MKKVVLKLDLQDDKGKQKAMSKVSGLAGVDSISMETNDCKLTVTGEVDSVVIVNKLRKLCDKETVDPSEKKKEEPKKEERKKAEEKKKDPNDVAC